MIPFLLVMGIPVAVCSVLTGMVVHEMNRLAEDQKRSRRKRRRKKRRR